LVSKGSPPGAGGARAHLEPNTKIHQTEVMKPTLFPVILAGGSGTRLWPLSREHYPKQFLSLLRQRTMLQETITRLDGMEGIAPPTIVCNEAHRFLVAEQARQAGRTPLAVLLEPVGRNTAPALTLAALALAESSSDPVMLAMPSDHAIRDVEAFQSTMREGIALAEKGHLVTFGVTPTCPHTGYGYIKTNGAAYPNGSQDESTDNADFDDENVNLRNLRTKEPIAYPVAAFVEKPDREAAQAFLRAGDYLWNSGIFMIRASVWLEQLKRHRPDIAEACAAAYTKGQRDGDFFHPDPKAFAECPSDSIDYAVMEKAAGRGLGTRDWGRGDTPPFPRPQSLVPSPPACVVLPLNAGWSDVGSWSALWDEGSHDTDGNVIEGDVYAQSVHNSLVIGQHRLVAVVGMDDVIVVETPDAILVAHKGSVQDVKELVGQLKARQRPEQADHRKVHRPWGHYETVDGGARFQVKRLTVNPGAALSLQMHHHRAEHWVVVKGTARVTRGEEVFLLTENQSAYVPVGVRHRLENPGAIPLEIIEVQSGSYLAEDDIVRFEDLYNRQNLAAK
jgi:mannose-1-phosphate guanylyltransferase/mannose-6-phosphate isomerase